MWTMLRALLIPKSFSVLIIYEPRYLKFSTLLTVFNSTVFVKLNAISSVLLAFKCNPTLVASLFNFVMRFWAYSISFEFRETYAKLCSVKMVGGILLLFWEVTSNPSSLLSHHCLYINSFKFIWILKSRTFGHDMWQRWSFWN